MWYASVGVRSVRLLSIGVRRLAALPVVLLLAHPLAGCAITGDEIAAALDIPKHYRDGAA